ncbi:T9SS sorting signal type C domain-containing protein [Flavobacterium sp.]|jgi:predicted outer membrane repeat protein|uniref:T9SS sorting signal type C domain-containing protein n=1 Tax=Flavobacterium sp. TaxID=239 RepID=UPI0037BFC2DB
MKKITFFTLCLTLFLVGNLYSQQTVWVKVGASGTGDGSSEVNAFTTIGPALLKIDSAGDILRVVGTVPASGISLNTTLANVSLNKTFAYTIEGDAAGSTLTGTASGTRMFTINGTSAGHNVTFKNIKFTGATGSKGAGGGVFLCNQPVTVKFENCIFDGNSLATTKADNTPLLEGGGALYFTGFPTVTITGCTFKNNSSPNIGGAISANTAKLTISKTTFYNNKTLGTVGAVWGGAALYVNGATSVNSLTNCTFYQNTSIFPVAVNQDYGAIRTENGNTTVTNCLFYDNKVAIGNPITSSAPADWGANPLGTQTFTYSIGQWISNNVDNRTNFISFVKDNANPLEVAANLTSSNLTFNTATNFVEYSDPTPGGNTPISFGNDGKDAGAWNSPNTWTGTMDTDWDQATNWSIKGVPDATKDALIAAAAPANQPIIASNTSVKSLTLNASTSLTVEGWNLTVTGAVTNNGGTMTLESNANLIQGGTTNTNTGNVIVKRNSALLKRLDYTLWSSPVTNAALFLKDFSPNTLDTRFYTYNTIFSTGGVNGAFSAVTPSTTNFTAGKGYSIRMPDNASADTPTAYAGEFTGVPNNGDLTAPLVDGGSAGLRYNLVGNPYPSPIQMQNFVFDNTDNIQSTLYFWRKTNGAGTAYCTWVAGALVTNPGTFASNGNAQTVNPADIIQTGQGFFVEAKSGATSLSFKNTQRVGNNTGQFFKTKQVAEASKIWLNATNAKGDFSQMAITYFAEATTGVDAFDAKYFNDSPIALTSKINDGEYTIQSRPAFDPTDVVALNFKTNAEGDYTIAIDHFEGLFSTGQDVYLVDSKTGTETNLKAGAYTFNATSGLDNNRFSLKYQKTLKVDAPAFNENSVSVYKNNGTIYVNSGKIAINSIQVYDVQGRLIADRKNVKSSTAALENLKANNQVVLVKISAEDNSVVTKKVVN